MPNNFPQFSDPQYSRSKAPKGKGLSKPKKPVFDPGAANRPQPVGATQPRWPTKPPAHLRDPLAIMAKGLGYTPHTPQDYKGGQDLRSPPTPRFSPSPVGYRPPAPAVTTPPQMTTPSAPARTTTTTQGTRERASGVMGGKTYLKPGITSSTTQSRAAARAKKSQRLDGYKNNLEVRTQPKY